MHVAEVMVVAMLAMIAYVSLVELRAASPDPPDIDLTVTPDMAHSVLVAYSTMPSKNESVWYSSQLEEWMVEAARDGHAEDLAWRLDQLFRHGDYRLWVQTETGVLQVHGEPRDALRNTATATHAYNPDWGVTILQPGMSHYNPTNPVDIQVLPLLAADTIKGAGEPYTAQATIRDTGGVTYTTATHGTLRAAHPSIHDLQLRLDFLDPTAPLDPPIDTMGTDDLTPTPAGLQWPISLRIQPHDPDHEGIWMSHGFTQRLELPTGWRHGTLGDPHNWTLLQDAPYLRLQWQGDTHRDARPAWLNLTLQHDDTVPIWKHEVVRAVAETRHSTTRHLFLEPDTDLYPAPLGLYVSQTDPLPPASADDAPYAFHITNPLDETVTLTNITFRVPRIASWFHTLENEWSTNAPPGWTLDTTTDDAVFTWDGTTVIAARGTATLQIGLKVDKETAPIFSKDVMPLLQHVLPDGTVRQETGALPYGSQGLYRAWFTPNATHLGPQAFRIPSDRAQDVPPGQGAFTMAPTPLAFLDDLQKARYSMEMSVEPRVHQPGDPLYVTLDTGDLFQTLKSIDGFQEDTLEVELYSADMWGVLTDQPYLEQSWPLDVGSASAITGLEWIDANGDPIEDLLVGYADGNLIALDGTGLPEQTIWRIDTPGMVTSGPIKVDTADGVRLVVAVEEADQYYVYHYTEQGALDSVRTTGGQVTHLTPLTCGNEPGYGYFLTTYDGGPQVNGGSGDYDGKRSGSAKVARWTVAQGSDSGPVHPASTGTYLREGAFGPYARCSLLAGYGGGLVEVVEAEGMEQTWQLKTGGTLRGLWAEDVRTLPIEDPTMPWFTGNRTDEVLVVTEEHGYEMFTGWVTESRPEFVSMPGLLPGDKLIGLSWVNYTTGYVASEMGYVWKTTDSGVKWDSLTVTPIVDAPRTLVDFAYGGDGRGIYVRDDLHFYEDAGDIKAGIWWPWTEGTKENYRGVGETSIGPGVIRLLPAEQHVTLHVWDYQQHGPAQVPGMPKLPCTCTAVVGGGHGLAGNTSDRAYFISGGILWNDAVEVSAASVAGIPRGLSNHDRMSVHEPGSREPVPLWGPIGEEIDTSNGGRHSVFASLVSGNMTIFDTKSGPAAQRELSGDVSSVAGGPGRPDRVYADGIWTSQNPSMPWAEVTGNDLTGQTTWTLRGFTGSYRIHTPTGPTHWTEAGGSTATASPEGKIEINAAEPIQEDDLTLTLNNESTSQIVRVEGDSLCTTCLRFISHAGSTIMGPGAHPSGPLPRIALPHLDADPALVRVSDGSWAVVARGPINAVTLLNATTGLSYTDVPDAPSEGDAYRIIAPKDGSSVWLLEGLLSGPPQGVRFVGPLSAQGYQGHNIDPSNGQRVCSGSWSDAWSLRGTVALRGASQGDPTIFGSDLGQLHEASLSDCTGWESTALATGTTIQWSFVPGSAEVGPHLVRSTIRFGVEGQGTIELYMLGESTGSTWIDKPQQVLHHTVAVSVWFV